MSAVSLFRLPPLTGVALACALTLGAVPFAHAENLQEVYDIARGYDATYLAARAAVDSVQYRAAQAHALRRPNVSATVGASQTTNETTVEGTTTSDLKTNGASGNILATQSLFNRANDATISQADLSLEIAKADLQTADQELIVRVATIYFDVLAAQDALTTAQVSKKAIAEQLAAAKRNFEVGTATITDTREAEARYDLSRAVEIGAENDLLTKRIALDRLIGRENVTPKPLAVPVVLPPASPNNVEEWVAGTDNTPIVRRAQIGYDIAQLETTKARAGHLPTAGLAASYGVGRSNPVGSQISGISPLPQNVDYWGNNKQSSIGVQVNIPLFAGFAVQNRVKETLSLEDQARNSLESSRRLVAQVTRQAFFLVQSQEAQVKALEAAEASSKVALESTQLGYKVGVRVNIDVLNAQTQLYATQRDLAKQRYDVLVNGLKLRQVAGILVPEDVSKVNALLER
ncbi:MAG TPA: TolC family outer membrane protein [Rhizobacter sp.]|nr:TolC family outer membrane protein [Rhizobacter sp.]